MILHLLYQTNAGIAIDTAWITDNEMKNWIGILFGMPLSPIPYIKKDGGEEDDGFYTRAFHQHQIRALQENIQI